MENSFEVGGRKFKIGKLDAFKQFHIMRRVAPILADLMPVLAGIAKQQKQLESMSQAEQLEKISEVAQPVMVGLSKLSDADADYVLQKLLSAVEVFQPQFNSWARVATDAGYMIQDLELPVILQAAARAFVHNLSGFFALLPPK